MHAINRGMLPVLLGALLPVAAAAQPAPAAQPAIPPGSSRASAPQQDLEPAVDTSATSVRPDSAAGTRAVTAADAGQGARAAGAANGTAGRAAATAGTAGSAARGGKAMDHIDLDTTDITGNRELPKVLYIVPWKRSDLGDLAGKPVNSLVDEVLEPVDRDVFNRENRYYHALAPAQSAAGAAAAAPGTQMRATANGAGPAGGAGAAGAGNPGAAAGASGGPHAGGATSAAGVAAAGGTGAARDP